MTSTTSIGRFEHVWQDIETAPKDRTVILVATSNWIAGSDWFDEGRWWTWHPPLYGSRPSIDGVAEPPTHWMLLPSPPKETPA